jgi:hypothetical protein
LQQRPRFQQQPPPAAEAEASLVGLPVYSSDGQKLGEVTRVGTVGGQRILHAEIGTFLGLGPSPVLIPHNVFEHKADRIEVAMTAAEVRDSVTRQKQQKQ